MRAHLVLGVVAAFALAGFGAGAQEKKTTGKDGKAYVEKATPFGTAKRAEKPADVKKKDEPPPAIRAYDEGDTVRFERQTPFGVAKWTKKKSELDETERAALARQQTKPAKP